MRNKNKELLKAERQYSRARKKVKLKRIKFVPLRFSIAMSIMLLEYASVIGGVVALTVYIPYFYFAVVFTQLACAIGIINSKDNPDYKSPWLFFVLLVPIIGFMSYFMFYSRDISKYQMKKIQRANNAVVVQDDKTQLETLKNEDIIAYKQVYALKKFSYSHLYTNTEINYFDCGEKYFKSILKDLKSAKQFIFMEYFIIENGIFWNSILDILEDKARSGVEVKIVYDDIGCMMKLPSRYYKFLTRRKISTVPFSKLRGQANSRINNRSHRKITIIDGKIAYTGGINIADEYINLVQNFGHWKDSGIRLEGEAVKELTKLFIVDFNINSKTIINETEKYLISPPKVCDGYCVPFGDGPKPMFNHHVSKNLILNMINQSQKYVFITTPYLIIDTELEQALENASYRGVDVNIITPHIPDKKLVFLITRSNYIRLLQAGVKIYEYEPGFIHSKTYMVDDKYAIVGTINMDYRSLVHHFENGVYICEHKVLKDIKEDFENTKSKSIQIFEKDTKNNIFTRFLWSLVNILAPLL